MAKLLKIGQRIAEIWGGNCKSYRVNGNKVVFYCNEAGEDFIVEQTIEELNKKYNANINVNCGFRAYAYIITEQGTMARSICKCIIHAKNYKQALEYVKENLHKKKNEFFAVKMVENNFGVSVNGKFVGEM